MIKSTALIEDYLDELLAKAVSFNYEDILKAIHFLEMIIERDYS